MHDKKQGLDKNDFWELIAQAKEKHGENKEAFAAWIEEELLARGPQAAQDFHDISHAYSDLAYKAGLWNAADILMDWCSDDGFIDFRYWLIAQGKEVYLSALKDPDSLAEVSPYGHCTFESLCYVGDAAYEKMTGKSAYEAQNAQRYIQLKADLGQEITYHAGIDKPREWNELEKYLPHLCAKYLPLEKRKELASNGTIWNYGSPGVKAMVQEAQKKEKGGEAR